ncbi:unnamed protein product [Rotaria sp. Silwood1]|nr:unnamed protein product [Rotaria sp. Silwood1]
MLASQQKLSSVQVASYILNLPNHYMTNEFQKIYLVVIENYLEKCLQDAKIRLENKSNMIENPSVQFGGINMVLFDDYMQYAPVLNKALFTAAVIQPSASFTNSMSVPKKSLSEYEIQCQTGRALILQVNVTVKLTGTVSFTAYRLIWWDPIIIGRTME